MKKTPAELDRITDEQQRAFAEGRVVYLDGILVDREDHPSYQPHADDSKDEDGQS